MSKCQHHDYTMVEDYIRGLQWSPDATDHEKSLVAGNIRGFYEHLRTSELPAASLGEPAVTEHIRRQVGRLAQWQHCMSYNDSYFGEPAGMVKQVVAELTHAVDPIYPPMPTAPDPLAGVTIHTATIPRTTPPVPAPSSAGEGELSIVREKLVRFAECAEDGDSGGCDIGREWFDALTLMGLLERTQRSPAIWTMTAAGDAFLTSELPAASLGEREAALEDLLRSAHAIASRHGADTAWDRFANSCKALSVGAVTARTYRVLPMDTAPAPSSAEEGDCPHCNREMSDDMKAVTYLAPCGRRVVGGQRGECKGVDYEATPKPEAGAVGDGEVMLGKMVETDFAANTITFEMRGHYWASAGLYEIRKAALARSEGVA